MLCTLLYAYLFIYTVHMHVIVVQYYMYIFTLEKIYNNNEIIIIINFYKQSYFKNDFSTQILDQLF